MPRPANQDPEVTRERILSAALEEFAARGFSAASTDRIAKAAGLTKRAVFYYFPSKEVLYTATLEKAYAASRENERQLHVATLTPVAALTKIVEATFDYYTSNPNFIRLVAAENMERTALLTGSLRLKTENRTIVEILDSILSRGLADGVFRSGPSALDIHMSISALSFFCVANAHTFGTIFETDMESDAFLAGKRREIVEIILRYLMF